MTTKNTSPYIKLIEEELQQIFFRPCVFCKEDSSSFIHEAVREAHEQTVKKLRQCDTMGKLNEFLETYYRISLTDWVESYPKPEEL